MSIFTNSNILIIGGAGFIGSNLTNIILKDGVKKLLIVDNLLSSEIINIPNDSRIKFFKSSITNAKILRKISDEFDYIFHLATYHGNQSSIYDPLRDHENNTLTTLKLYERIKHFKKIKKIIYSSAGCAVAKKTFDSPTATTEEEYIGLNQDSPYSISKIIGEFYSVYYYKRHSLPIVRARFQNVYGPKEILGAGKWRGTAETVWRNVIPTFIFKALKCQKLPVENKGITTRDFIFVEDVCRGLIACAAEGKPGEVYNIASGKETKIKDLAIMINKMTNNNAGIMYLPKRYWDNSGRRFGSTLKIKRELSFRTEFSLEDGLKRTIEWTKKNLSLIEFTIAKHNNKMKLLLK